VPDTVEVVPPVPPWPPAPELPPDPRAPPLPGTVPEQEGHVPKSGVQQMLLLVIQLEKAELLVAIS
jgi:hypothetical protein